MSKLRLDERIPEKGFTNPDDALDAFLAWASDSGLTLYAHQESAILELFAGHHVILDAPTGSGKSLVATAMHFKTFCELGRAWYTAPIKALVSEKFFELCNTFGAEHVGMLTGDASINPDAPIICCTAEILSDLAMREGTQAKVTSVVMDEFHYYADRDRGMAWQVPLLTLANTAFLLMSGTLGDTSRIRDDLEQRTQRRAVEVLGAHRPVPLTYSYSSRPLTEAIDNLVRGNKAPVYLVHFSQREATEQAQALMSVDYCTKDEKRAIAENLRGFSFHSPFGATLRRYVAHGVGLHHAGLLPRYRLLVERLAQRGLLKVICGTDTLGVGINVPIRSVLFTKLCKFDGEQVVTLPVRDFRQIAGRAGRAGYDTEGFVVVQAPAHVIENTRAETNAAGDPKKLKKLRKAQPPDRGYKHWDQTTFDQLTIRPPEPLTPRLAVRHGHLLSLLQHAEANGGDGRPGYDALLALINASHVSQPDKDALTARAAGLLEQLSHVGVVQPHGDKLTLDPTLPPAFTLHHPLSLLLVDGVGSLDVNSPTHALDVLTWVEAILEHPKAILLRQQAKARDEAIAEMKAQGVPYEERIERLEEVTYPKPLGEQLYTFYNTYRERHPWVADDPIRPKSIARDMIERYASFSEYVRELGLERIEGVLLRYLSDVYRALVQNVPGEANTDALEDLRASLRATLAVVDASLVLEWEQLLTGADAPAEQPRKADISADPKRFAARVRAELHALVRALSREAWDEAEATVFPDEHDPWTADRLRDSLAPFIDAYDAVAFDHRARLGPNTQLTKTGSHQWSVRQRLLPRATSATDTYRVAGWVEDVDEGTWAIEATIDLRADTCPDGPLLRLNAIGA